MAGVISDVITDDYLKEQLDENGIEFSKNISRTEAIKRLLKEEERISAHHRHVFNRAEADNFAAAIGLAYTEKHVNIVKLLKHILADAKLHGARTDLTIKEMKSILEGLNITVPPKISKDELIQLFTKHVPKEGQAPPPPSPAGVKIQQPAQPAPVAMNAPPPIQPVVLQPNVPRYFKTVSAPPDWSIVYLTEAAQRILSIDIPKSPEYRYPPSGWELVPTPPGWVVNPPMFDKHKNLIPAWVFAPKGTLLIPNNANLNPVAGAKLLIPENSEFIKLSDVKSPTATIFPNPTIEVTAAPEFKGTEVSFQHTTVRSAPIYKTTGQNVDIRCGLPLEIGKFLTSSGPSVTVYEYRRHQMGNVNDVVSVEPIINSTNDKAHWMFRAKSFESYANVGVGLPFEKSWVCSTNVGTYGLTSAKLPLNRDFAMPLPEFVFSGGNIITNSFVYSFSWVGANGFLWSRAENRLHVQSKVRDLLTRTAQTGFVPYRIYAGSICVCSVAKQIRSYFYPGMTSVVKLDSQEIESWVDTTEKILLIDIIRGIKLISGNVVEYKPATMSLKKKLGAVVLGGVARYGLMSMGLTTIGAPPVAAAAASV